MLVSVKINNCLIYNSETEVSMQANRHYKRFPNNVASFKELGVLKTAVIFGVPRYSGYRYAAFRFTYWTITVYGHIFQSVLFTICIQCRGPTTPLTPCDVNGLGCSPFARHY